MSAIIEELRLKNFGGYRSAHLRFSAGLNLIRGRNSAGKSTLLDGLVFALYGEVPGVKPKLMVSRLPRSKEMSAYIRFRSPRSGDVVEVMRRGALDDMGRYRTKERTLAINGRNVDIEGEEGFRVKITELMGISLRKFLDLVYVRQGELTAVLEPPKDRMDSIIGITLLRELREQLDEVRRELGKYEGRDVITEARSLERLVIPQLMSNLRRIRNDIKTLRSEVRKLQEVVRKGESMELTDLLFHIERRDDCKRGIQGLKAKMQELLRNVGVSSFDELKLKVRDWTKQLKSLENSIESLSKTMGELEDSWAEVKGRASSLEDEVRERWALLKRGMATCPTCGQDIDPDVLRGVLQMDEDELKKLRARERELKAKCEAKRSELDRLRERQAILTSRVSALRAVESDFRNYSRMAGDLSGTLERELSSIREMLLKLNLPLQPEDPELKVKIAQRLPIQPEELEEKRGALEEKEEALDMKLKNERELEEKLKASEELLRKLRRRTRMMGIARVLSEEFDRAIKIRRRSFLKHIELKALEYYGMMTDQRVYSAISIDPERYAVSVYPKGLRGALPATRVGGGHQTILSLAIRLALLEALGFRLLLILDEPTYGIDSENLPQLASYISEASRQISQTILVTHHDICEEEALNIINVTVKDGVSRAKIMS